MSPQELDRELAGHHEVREHAEGRGTLDVVRDQLLFAAEASRGADARIG